MSRYGVILKSISLILVVLFFIAINIDTKSILDDELAVYKQMNENNKQEQEQIDTSNDNEVYDANEITMIENTSLPLSHTFAKIFGSFWTIILAIILGISGRIIAPKKLR